MDFYDVLAQIVKLLQQRGRLTYRGLTCQFELDDETLAALKEELLYSQPQVVDDPGQGLRWTGALAVPKIDRQHAVEAESRYHAMLRAAMALLQCERRVTYRELKHILSLDDALLEEIRNALHFKQLARDERGEGLVWTAEEQRTAVPPGLSPTADTTADLRAAPTPSLPDTDPHRPSHEPTGTTPETMTISTPQSESVLAPEPQRSASEAERRQLTVMFCDLPDSTPLAHFMLGSVLFFREEPAGSHVHHTQAMTMYDPQAHQALVLHIGLDISIVSRAYLALELWLLGYPDQAMQYIQEARRLAQKVSHPYSLCLALLWSAVLHQFRREARAAHEHAEAAMTLAKEQAFVHWVAWGMALHGWAQAMQGQGEAGLVEIRQGVAADRATGDKLFQAYFLGLLADTCGEDGHLEAGLHALSEAVAVMDTTEARFYTAELYRLTGALLLKQAVSHAPQAETCFHQALELARQQQAKSWELRAATSLAHLWQQQGKRQDAYDLLTPVYEWFTEGFDTADLRDAKRLLDQLRA